MNRIYFIILVCIWIIAMCSMTANNIINSRGEFLEFKEKTTSRFEAVEQRVKELEKAPVKEHGHDRKGSVK